MDKRRNFFQFVCLRTQKGLKKETYSKEKHHKNQVENEDHWSHSESCSEFVHEELDSDSYLGSRQMSARSGQDGGMC